jgi:MFS family permease
MVSAPMSSRAATYSPGEAGYTVEAPTSGISWPAILGGAFAAAALSLILLGLGSGFGLASVSPWSNSGASATTFTIITAIWLIIVQWLSSGFGGYLTGRLRTKWVGVHTHEVFFRDTANGFLAWAVAAVLSAAVLASAASSLVAGGVHVAGIVTSEVAEGASQSGIPSKPSAYWIDKLFRSDHPNATGPDSRGEAARILAADMNSGEFPDGDATYLAQLVAARTGISQADAKERVDGAIANAMATEMKARQFADAARKAGAYLSVFTAVSMLIGAFIAAAAAAVGGRQRDEEWRVL